MLDAALMTAFSRERKTLFQRDKKAQKEGVLVQCQRFVDHLPIDYADLSPEYYCSSKWLARVATLSLYASNDYCCLAQDSLSRIIRAAMLTGSTLWAEQKVVILSHCYLCEWANPLKGVLITRPYEHMLCTPKETIFGKWNLGSRSSQDSPSHKL